MTDPARESNRRAKNAFKGAERAREIASSPVPLPDLHALLEAVSHLVLDDQGRNLCDHTHRLTWAVIRDRGIGDIDAMTAFLRSKGFFCDCEVALNLASWLEWNRAGGEVRHQ